MPPEKPYNPNDIEEAQEKEPTPLLFRSAEATQAKNYDLSRPVGTNQDAVLSMLDKGLFAVFDGVGGSTGGHEASQIAKQSLHDIISIVKERGEITNTQQAERLMYHMMTSSNQDILFAQAENKDLKEMSTTVASTLFWTDSKQKNWVTIGHVGDSRIYRMSNIFLDHLTLDDGTWIEHYLYEDALKLQKELSNVSNNTDTVLKNPLNNYIFRHRNRILQCLGNNQIDPHVITFPVLQGERFLLATDGLTDNLTDLEIQEILINNKDTQKATDELLKKATDRTKDSTHIRWKPDDISFILVETYSSSTG